MTLTNKNLCGWLALPVSIVAATAACASPSHLKDRDVYRAPHAEEAPVIDGVASETTWSRANWRNLNHRWLGPEYAPEDFTGRYKVVWTREKLFILTEFTDDVLIDRYRDPLDRYWDDDSLEIFLDENFSGGIHQYNHNAFAYHLSLDNQAIDVGTDKKPHNYSHHIESRWKQSGDKVIWETAIDVFADNYVDGSNSNVPVALTAGKQLGLMVAYCDNDGSEIRENFVGSHSIPKESTDRGWIDADLFGKLVLDE